MNFPNRNPKWILPDRFAANSGKVYTLSHCIGEGGNACVYEGTDNDGNLCAVKILKQSSDQARTRFNQEVSLMKKIRHAFLISYFDNGTVQGIKTNKQTNHETFSFIVMEKADTDLFSYLKKHEWKVEYDVYAPQFRGLSEALGKLHEQAIHRDIKPANILVKGERWVLSDFGLCTMTDENKKIDVTRPNEKIGPKFCPSPESINQSYAGTSFSIDASSDVYQLCAVFWLVLTGWYPLGQIKSGDYTCNDKSRPLFENLLLALSYDKQKRPQDGFELLEIMRQVTIEQGLRS